MDERRLRGILDNGPDAIMVGEAETRTPDLAAQEFGIGLQHVDVILVTPALTIGAPRRLFRAAERAVSTHGITHFILRDDDQARPYADIDRFVHLLEPPAPKVPDATLEAEHVELLDQLHEGGHTDVLRDGARILGERFPNLRPEACRPLVMQWAEGYADRKGAARQ